MNQFDPQLLREVSRRRTFAIISHPDAGKTKLTEKLLLFGGCIDVAGAVRGRKAQRAATSDWLELEKQRGISVSSTVLTFEFKGRQVNLLDTPGHHDFSEDTYRTLMAADCAVMVIDLAKGVETQTEKLFRVCALRKIPVITFVNKVDRPVQSPLAVLEEIESKFGIDAVPQNWPLGTGQDYAGIVFKIQANLDPRHRDRIAFVRVCAGRFRRDMEVLHTRTGEKLWLRRAHRVFGRERETMDEAFPGDIVGLVNPGEFHLGDTICEGPAVSFDPLPQFSPENFAILRCRNTDRRKQSERGLSQLLEEGAIQVFSDPHAVRREPMLAAVGELQFDVVRFRLESEYDTPTDLQWLPFKLARWVDDDPAQLQQMRLPYSAKMVRDQFGHHAVLFHSQWDAEYASRENPEVRFSVMCAGRAV
ncbi:MAG: GTP-binding protein [Thermoguttaceae bacterium]|nr:GTP-binding protein [Thermoguttaceae bacterium]